MQQIKLFKSVEAEVSQLEEDINRWMREVQKTGGRIVQVAGNIAPQTVSSEGPSSLGRFSPSDLFVMVVYEPGEE